jgi:hypothetical protein
MCKYFPSQRETRNLWDNSSRWYTVLLFYPNKINTTFFFYCVQLILRDYIDAAFEGMMDALSLPVHVRYFLCMLDKQGRDIGVDNDVLQAWKSEW